MDFKIGDIIKFNHLTPNPTYHGEVGKIVKHDKYSNQPYYVVMFKSKFPNSNCKPEWFYLLKSPEYLNNNKL